jgi:predicted nucleic acid-binding protein
MIGLDTSFLLAAEGRHDAARWRAATSVLDRLAATEVVVPAQAMAEMLQVLKAHMGASEEEAGTIAARWLAAVASADVSPGVIAAAKALAATGHVAMEDALILAAVREAGADILLSEDFAGDVPGAGVRIINPFTPEGEARLAALLGPALN